MKLLEIDSRPQRKPLDPTLRFNNNAGRITISKGAYEALKISSKGKFSLFQDEESKDDWYVTFDNQGAKDIRVKIRKGLSDVYEVNSKELVTKFFEYFNYNKSGFTIDIDIENPIKISGREFYKLFTTPLKVAVKSKAYEFKK